MTNPPFRNIDLDTVLTLGLLPLVTLSTLPSRHVCL